MAVGISSSPEPLVLPDGTNTSKSSSRGNERMRLKIRKDGTLEVITRKDLNMGENPRNGLKETFDMPANDP